MRLKVRHALLQSVIFPLSLHVCAISSYNNRQSERGLLDEGVTDKATYYLARSLGDAAPSLHAVSTVEKAHVDAVGRDVTFRPVNQ